MRLHFLVLLVVGLVALRTYGYPMEEDERTNLEESFTDPDKVKEEASNDEEEDEEEDETGDKKASIATTDDEPDDEEIEENDKENADTKSDVKESEDDVTPEDLAKKDDIKASTKKESGKESAKIATTKETDTSEKKHHQKKSSDNKKWWMVEGPHKWGGMGHSHWGPPHKTETDNEHHEEANPHGTETEGAAKDTVPSKASCCKSKDSKSRKRCGCDAPPAEVHQVHQEHQHVPSHADGYHFHDKGSPHPHNNDHDHNLRGAWSFGYDGFGDDWGDWDHNHGKFSHLKAMEKESHGGHHEEVHGECHGAACHGDHPAADHGEHASHPDCHKRDCVTVAPLSEQAEVEPPLGPPLGATIIAGPVPAPVPLPAGPVELDEAPPPLFSLPPPVAHGPSVPYRVCHACHPLPDGGSRCLCKVKHRHAHAVTPHHGHHAANTHFNHHVYVDCDAAVHNFPDGEKTCHARHDIPTPEHAKHASGEAKQSVIYPYVGYGPWAAYPWWGDWWGGHGNHGWSTNGCGTTGAPEAGAAPCAGGCGDGKDKNVVEVEHGKGLVHHDHGAQDCGHNVGNCGKKRSPACDEQGSSPNSALPAYRCHDLVHDKKDDASRSKRFCVPVGNNGGYGWPYWHGYPGVGTGLWGWGWPWIKHKVPGSKGNTTKPEENKEQNKAKFQNKDAKPSTSSQKKSHIHGKPSSHTRRSFIHHNANPHHSHSAHGKTKKQTIHMGYGYASGDNYRLGYGFGGMGGVQDQRSGAEIGSPFSRSTIESDYRGRPLYKKMKIPTPEKLTTVTGTKRDESWSHHEKGRKHTHH